MTKKLASHDRNKLYARFNVSNSLIAYMIYTDTDTYARLVDDPAVDCCPSISEDFRGELARVDIDPFLALRVPFDKLRRYFPESFKNIIDLHPCHNIIVG